MELVALLKLLARDYNAHIFLPVLLGVIILMRMQAQMKEQNAVYEGKFNLTEERLNRHKERLDDYEVRIRGTEKGLTSLLQKTEN